MASVTLKNIIPTKNVEDSLTVQYTSPAKCLIDKFTATNITSSAVDFYVYLTASGGTTTTTNLIINRYSIGPYETYTCPEIVGHVIEAGGFISTLAGSALSISIRASGREIT